MRVVRFSLAVIALSAAFVAAQTPQRGAQPPVAPAAPDGRGGRGGRGGGRGAIPVMTLTSSAFPDGGQIPAKYTQVGGESSPPLTWSNVPEGVASFVLIAHDVDSAIGNGTDDLLHWLVWNIPATATGLPEHVPAASQLPDGARQISATSPGYPGPAALSSGPAHHYVFELYALDSTVDVPAIGASPPQTRAAVVAAMAGHVRGKAV